MISYIEFLAEGSRQVSQGKLNEEQWVKSLSHYSAGRRAAIDELNLSGVTDLHKHWDIIHSRGLEHMLRNGRSTASQMAESGPKLKKAVDDLGEENAQQVLDDTHSAAKTYINWLHERGQHFDGNVTAMGGDIRGEVAGKLMGRKGGKPDKSDIVAISHDVKYHPDIFLKRQGFKSSKIDDATRNIFQLAVEHTEGAADHSDKINSILDNHGIDAEKRADIVDRISNYQKKALQRYSGISSKYSSTGSTDIKISQMTTRDILNAAKTDKNSEAYKTLEVSKGFSDEIRQLIYNHPIIGPMVRAVHGPNPKKIPQDAFKMARRANDFLVKRQKPSPSLLAYAEKVTDATNLKLGDVIKSLSGAHEEVREKQKENVGRITDAMHDSIESALKDTNKRWAFLRGLAGQTPTRQEGGAVTNLVSVISKGKGKQPDTKVITLQSALDTLQREHQENGRYKGHDWWVERSDMSMNIKHGIKNDPKTHRTVYSISGDVDKAITEKGTGSSMSVYIPSNSPIMDRSTTLETSDDSLEKHIAHPDEAGSNQHGGSSFYAPGER